MWILPRQGIYLASSQAGVASDAGLLIEGYFKTGGFALRVVAPDTGHGATFEKHNSANTWAIIKAISFNFKNKGVLSGNFHKPITHFY